MRLREKTNLKQYPRRHSSRKVCLISLEHNNWKNCIPVEQDPSIGDVGYPD